MNAKCGRRIAATALAALAVTALFSGFKTDFLTGKKSLERHLEQVEIFAEQNPRAPQAWFLLGSLRLTSGDAKLRKTSAAPCVSPVALSAFDFMRAT